MANPVGRPSKYKPEYCQDVIDTMREGVSLTAFAGRIGVARSSINEWIEHFPEFSEAVNIGKAACAAWYNLQAREVVMKGGSGAQATLIVFGLKNMDSDSWRDRKEVDHSGNLAHTVSLTDMTDDELAGIAAGRSTRVAGTS